MFSSLASFIFGSNTSATSNSKTNQNPTRQEQEFKEKEQFTNDDEVRIVANNIIEVTSLTPSVAGANTNSVIQQLQQQQHLDKRFKKKRNLNKKNKNQTSIQEQKKSSTPSITKLLTPTESSEEDSGEDDWIIVENEEEEDSLPRTDSEEDFPTEILKPISSKSTIEQGARQRYYNQNLKSHSLYSGPRPQQQRNYLQKTRNFNSSACNSAPKVSALKPPRCLNAAIGADITAADGGLTQSLYVVSSNRDGHNTSSDSNTSGFGANISMEESWFVTPPPCFTSIGPINMETSPFENLLIEHPSMSVYHSIRSAQEATESFVNLDLGVVEESQQRRTAAAVAAATTTNIVVTHTQNIENNRDVQRRSTNVRADRCRAVQLKQELMARNSQKCHVKKEQQNLRRGAIKRANKVRDIQGKGNRQRRSDMQHCKIISGVNNNRKCY